MLGNKVILTKVPFVFDFFLENNISPLYENTVLNTLNSSNISVENHSKPIFGSLICLVKDIPDYLQLRVNQHNTFKRRTVTQYKGYLIDLNTFNNSQDYLKQHLSKRNKKNLLSKKRKLETSYQISYKVFQGDNLSKEGFDQLFSEFYSLLKKRFQQKRTFNRYLSNWEVLKATSFTLLRNRKASIFVILDQGKPINITLNFHVGDTVYSHIQTYDLKYKKFNLGDISIFKQLEWCVENNIKLYDLLMGKTYYKMKWCNKVYTYSYDIFYKKNNPLATVLAYAIGQKLRLKQYLRDKDIIGPLFSYDKFIYEWRFGKNKL